MTGGLRADPEFIWPWLVWLVLLAVKELVVGDKTMNVEDEFCYLSDTSCLAMVAQVSLSTDTKLPEEN